MESLAATGAKVVACICIKPKPLCPALDQRIVMPNDVGEWQQVIEALVRRYSVEREIVTHWEIGNETDIGEAGGCPYLTEKPEQYNEYYAITREAVLRAFPEAKVGGPALAYPDSPIMEGFVKYCADNGTPPDFISWHQYNDDAAAHARHVINKRALLEKTFPGKHVEMMVTEFAPGFYEASVAEVLLGSRHAAITATAVFAMMDARLDWSFYYHIWDQVNVAGQFASFFEDADIMLSAWNKAPFRNGLFGVRCEVRPTYFAYQLLERMGGDEAGAVSGAADLRVKGAIDGKGGARAMLINHDARTSRDMVAEIDFAGISGGLRLLNIYRIDDNSSWDEDTLTLTPVESRYVDISNEYSKRPFYCHVYCPADSVALVELVPVTEAEMLAEYGF